MLIRPATDSDLALLPAIEVAAGEAFRALGMDAVADDAPPTVEDLAAYQVDGRAWVAVDAADRPVGYALALEVDGGAHLEQVTVHPAAAGHRIGSALIDEVDRWAAGHGLAWLTLTTFVDVPWNAPYYDRLGFRAMAAETLPAGLRSIREHERAHGLDAWPRVTMRRAVGGTG